MSRATSSLRTQSRSADSAGRPSVVRHVWFSVANVLFALVIGLALVAAVGLTILPRVIGFQTYIVLSGSMEPTIPTASVVVVVPVKPSDLQAGDIISFTRWTEGEEPATITHRINQVVEPGTFPRFETKGDANPIADPLTVRYLGPAGKVVFVVPYLGHFFHFARSFEGRLALLILPGALFSVLWLWGIWKPKPTPPTESLPAVEPHELLPVTPFQAEVMDRARELAGDDSLTGERKLAALRHLAKRAERAADPRLEEWLRTQMATLAPDAPETSAGPAQATLDRPPVETAPRPVLDLAPRHRETRSALRSAGLSRSLVR